MANMTFSKKSLYDFMKSNSSLQLQANFEFRWPLIFNENSFLIDTLEIPEVDSTQGYMYLDGYQIPVLGTPRFTNAIRLSFWAEEPFFKKYEMLFRELLMQHLEGSEAFIIPCDSDSKERISSYLKAFHFYDVRLKQIMVDEHSASSQALMHVNLTLVFGAYDVTDANKDVQTATANNGGSTMWDVIEYHNALIEINKWSKR